MRTTKKILTLLVIVILLGVAYFLRGKSGSLVKKEEKKAFMIDFRKIDKINIFAEGKRIILVKKEGRWFQEKKGKIFKADEKRVGNLISTAKGLDIQTVISHNPKNFTSLGVNDNKIEFYQGKKKVGELFVGKAWGVGEDYLRIRNTVFIGSSFNDIIFPSDFRDLSLHFISSQSKPIGIIIRKGGKTMSFRKKGDDWVINGKTADRKKMDYLINDLETLRASDIVSSPKVLESLTPYLYIKVRLGSGKVVSLRAQKQKEGEKEFYLIEIEGKKVGYKVDKFYLENVDKDASYFTKE